MARAAEPSATPVARASWLRRQLSNALLVEVSLVAIVFGVLSGRLVGYIVAAAVALVTLLLLIPIRGRSLLRGLALRTSYSRRRPAPVPENELPLDLVPLAEWVSGLAVTRTVTGRGGEVGVITDGSAWAAVLALRSDDELLADKGEAIDIDSLAALTVQDDVVFAGVQLVTYTVPSPTLVLLGEGSRAASAYLEITAEQPPPTVRRSWLCLRLDPRLCLEAVARRGAGNEGIYATLRFGLHRAQSVLKRQGIETRALTPMEINEVLSLTVGSGPERSEQRTAEGWSHWQCDGLLHTGQLVRRWGANMSAGYRALLDAVASAPVLFAVTSYTMTRSQAATGGIRLVSPNAESATVAIAHVTRALGSDVRLAPAGGTQVPTMLATVPLGLGAVL